MPTATDNCSGTINATTTSPLTYNTQGTYTVVWNFNDGNGNTSTQNQTVIVTHGGSLQTYYQDLDEDGFGNNAVSTNDCTQPIGYVLNSTDCNDNEFSLTNTCMSVVNLKLFIEGYYLEGNTMTSVNTNQGISGNTTDVDSITVELRNAINYQLVATTEGTLKTDGTVECNYTNSVNGSYYVVVKSKNAIETWSANPLTVGTTPLSYDFSNGSNKAFGGNMKEVSNGVWAFYSGDTNQDGLIDPSDYSMWETDANNFEFGNLPTDLNGDGGVDASDYSIWEGNANNFITIVTP